MISDYKMPGMTGIKLFDKIKSINPAVTRIMINAFEIRDEWFNDRKCVDI